MPSSRSRMVAATLAASAVLAASPALAAQAPGTYQRTVTKTCVGLCTIPFPATGSKILLVESVNCGFSVAAANTPLEVRLISDKNDGVLFLAPQLTYASSSYRTFVVSQATAFQISAGAKMAIATNIPGSFATPQTCTVTGSYM